jgi:hypothetical protein
MGGRFWLSPHCSSGRSSLVTVRVFLFSSIRDRSLVMMHRSTLTTYDFSRQGLVKEEETSISGCLSRA